MKAHPNPNSDYSVTDTTELTTEEMVDEMEIQTGDSVATTDDPHKSDIMKVDAIDLGYISFHYPHVDHPQDAKYGGRGAFDQPVEEWYADWMQGNLKPANVEVSVE